MKNLFLFLTLIGLLFIGFSFNAYSRTGTDAVVTVQEGAAQIAQPTASAPAATSTQGSDISVLHKTLKVKFIEGGAGFMGTILLCLIFGLALAFERIIYLNLSTTNTNKLIIQVNEALESGNVDSAKEVCRNTRGPVASIFYQGLDRLNEGIDAVEKSVVSYGSVQMGLLEKGLSWIQLFIAIAPMLGFLGTVIGMIDAFDKIQMAGDISPALLLVVLRSLFLQPYLALL